MRTVKIYNDKKISSVEAEVGTTLLETLRKTNRLNVDTSCGGRGVCGKCRVKIISKNLPEPTSEDIRHLSTRELAEGYRLACQVKLVSDCEIEMETTDTDSQILIEYKDFSGRISPVVRKKFLELSTPSLQDQQDDISRVLEAIPAENVSIPHNVRAKIPTLLRDSEYKLTAVYSSDKLIALEPGNTEEHCYGIAVDIGTTTVAAYLVDFNTGSVIDVESALNSQKVFGADIISRIEYSMKEPEKRKEMQNKILIEIGELCFSLGDKNGISMDNVYSVVLAGNTSMLHFAFGVDASGIAVAPFVPGFLGAVGMFSHELEAFPFHCLVYSLPSISAYIGADIVAGILATLMYEREELSLFVDLGTNGEIVLGNREKLYACSTAAGPAFEGAHITCGMGGISGAIDSVVIEDGSLRFTSIGNGKALGICGSGIVDLMAELLKSGMVDYTGRLMNAEEVKDGKTAFLLSRLKKDDEITSLQIASASENGKEILFTQKDIREIQLAKAAVAAGIMTLLHRAGRETGEIDHVFLAGGFGNYISTRSAAEIGLIPAELLDRTESVGNTAALGAITCALTSSSEKDFNACRGIADLTEYVELSGNTFFNAKFLEEITFPS